MSRSKMEALEFLADTVEEVCSNYDIPVKVVGGTSTLILDTLQIILAKGTKIAKLKTINEEIALALGVSTIRITTIKNAISIEIPKEHQKLSNRLNDILKTLNRMPPYCALLGIDTNGQPILLRLNSPEVVHILIAGQTGSGKTVLLRSMIISLAYFNAQRHLQIVLIDPKSRGFEPLKKIPHVIGNRVITDPMEATQRLIDLTHEMVRRDNAGISDPKIVVCVDELVDLIMVGGDAVRDAITRIGQRGREAGIHLIAATQKPSASIISGLLKANFPIRIVGTVASKSDANHATGISGSGAEKLEGNGDFLMIKSGVPERFKGAWVDSTDYQKILATITGRPLQKEV